MLQVTWSVSTGLGTSSVGTQAGSSSQAMVATSQQHPRPGEVVGAHLLVPGRQEGAQFAVRRHVAVDLRDRGLQVPHARHQRPADFPSCVPLEIKLTERVSRMAEFCRERPRASLCAGS